jgi:amino acid adenylation domain-containing protein
MTYKSVQELFSDAADRFEDHTAIERIGERVSYGELDRHSNRMANYLLSRGTPKGAIVAVLSDDPITFITSLIAVLKAGCVFVPFDPGIPEKRLQAMVSEVSPSWFVVQPKLVPDLKNVIAAASSRPRIICMEGATANRFAGVDVEGLVDFAGAIDERRPDLISEPDDLAYIYFTSGSTGRPKGIVGRLKGIDHFIRWEIKTFEASEGIRVSQMTSPSFDAFLRDVFTPLCAGGTICLPDSRDVIFDGAKLANWIDDRQINLIHCVPSVFRGLLAQDLGPDRFQALKYVLLSGEPLLPADVKRWTGVFGERIQLVNLYGPTETTMTKFFYMVKPADAERRLIPIGKPMEGARALVVDAKGQACSPGAVGEIYIRTPYRTLGYYSQPELTKESFVLNPFSNNPNDLVYKTGDLGRVLDDGNFEFLGRKDQQVKIRGVRIELKEIESILREHPQISEAAVIDREDGAANKYLCAYVVLRNKVEIALLKEFVAESLPIYMIPSAFIVMDALPRTISGKLDRKALPAINDARTGSTEAYVAPRTAVEEILVGVWSNVIGIEPIGVHDSFFELGGHSLLATQLLSRVNKALNVELPLRSLFESPTVEEQARQVAAARQLQHGTQASPIKPVSRKERLPLSFAQQRLWFLDRLQPGCVFYNLPIAVHLKGELNIGALQRTVDEITRRHEVLRTRFETLDGKPFQAIVPPRAAVLAQVDLSGSPEQQQWARVQQWIDEDSRRPFDLEAGPLLRVKLLRLGPEDHVALFTIHHIIADGGSLALLVHEVATLYEAFSTNKQSPLPELKVQYADYAVWQRDYLNDGVLEKQLDYWRNKLAGAPRTVNLQADYSRPEVQSYRGAALSQSLSTSLSDELKKLSKREGVTLFMTLLAAFKALIYCNTRLEDIVLGSPITNRNQLELEELIGLFANTLVLRTDLSGNPSFIDLLARVRETTLEAYANQDLPFEKLVDELSPERNLSHNPLFQVAFTLDNASSVREELPGITFRYLDTPISTVQFDLILHMVDTAKGLHSSLQYSTDLFSEASIRRLLTQFEKLLELVAAQPHATLDELRVALMEADKEQWAIKEKGVDAVGFDKLRIVKRKALTGVRIEREAIGHESLEQHGA